MNLTRRYKHNYSKRLQDKRSMAGKRSQRIQALKREANPRIETLEDIIERHKRDRKGTHFATMERKGLRLDLYYSLNRSDQFDVIATRPCKWSDGTQSERINNLSMPKVIKLLTGN